MESHKAEKKKIEKSMEELKKDLAMNQAELQAILKEKLIATKRMTPEEFKNAYKYLVQHYNEEVAQILERLIGKLRNQERTDQKYVELYMRKFEDFQQAVSKFEPRKCNSKAARADIEFVMKDDFKKRFAEAEKEYNLFRNFYDLLLQVCYLILNSEKAMEVEGKIEKKEQAIEQEEKQIQEKEEFLKTTSYITELEQEIAHYKNEKVKHFEERYNLVL